MKLIYPSFDTYGRKIKANIHGNINDPILMTGMPIPSKVRRGALLSFEGGCAIIFKIQVNNKFYALKCWQREISGLEKRLVETEKYLKTISLPYFVDFSFCKNGFKDDNGKFFPILRMDWVEGDTLTNFVLKNIGNQSKIKDIAKQFLEMVQKLHANNISHCDLQGGNIMVKQNDDICLIDYDGICTPSLQNEKDNIAGLPGFQHPFNKKTLGLKADYFSELVIYLSLLAFSEDKKLAQNIDNKKWLFSEDDLKKPDNSLIIKKLLKMSSDIQSLTKQLIGFCKTDASKLQPLEDIVGSNINSWGKGKNKQGNKKQSTKNVLDEKNIGWNNSYKKPLKTIKKKNPLAPIPTVTNVTIENTFTSIDKGKTHQFKAKINGTNNPPKSVYWKINGNTSNQTYINSNGELTVANNENANALTIITTSTFDKSKSNSITVTVTDNTRPPPPPPPRLPAPGVPTIIRGRERLDVSWSYVYGADEYEVYYSTSLHGTKTKKNAGSGLSYTLTGLDSDTTYYVWLKAKDNTGRVSDFSQYASKKPQVYLCRMCNGGIFGMIKPKPGEEKCFLCKWPL